MEIRPGWGVGQFRFGLTEADLTAALGPPDKSYTTESDVRRLQYFGPRLEFAIEPENAHRFGWAEIHAPDATLCGRRVVGEAADGVVAAIGAALGEPPEREDVGSGESYFFPSWLLELQVKFGRIATVNFGVLHGADGEPLWPGA